MIDLVVMTADHVGECAAIVADLPLYQAYGLDVDRARRAIDTACRDDRNEMVVAVRDGQSLGFAWFVPRGVFDRSAYLRQIAIRGDCQGQGIGELLLRELERRHLEPNGVALLVTATNTGARRFYERLGYRYVGTLEAYAHPDHDECLYVKQP